MKIHLFNSVLALFLSVITFNIKGQDTLIIYPHKDAVISFDNPGANFGNDSLITAKCSDGPTEVLRSLIAFELDPVPDSIYIYSAKLYLSGINHDIGTGSNAFILQRIEQSWDEESVTWENQPSTVSTDQINLSQSSYYNEDYEIDIKVHLLYMLQEGYSHGFMMMLSSEEPSSSIEFASSDGADSEVPKIVIVYEIPKAISLVLNVGSVNNMDSTSGIIDLDVYGGISPYTYAWSDGTNNWTTQDLSNLDVGVYSITVTDQQEIQVTSQVSVGYPMMFENGEALINSEFRNEELDPCLSLMTENGNIGTVNSWDNGVSSSNTIPSNSDGWVEYTVESADFNRMFGLSEIGISDGEWEDIDYGLYLNDEYDLIRVESGTQYSITNGTYEFGDVLKVERDGNDIIYRKNGIVIHTTSEVGSSDELSIDLNIYHAGTIMSGLRTSGQIPFEIDYTVDHVSDFESPNGSITITTTSMEGLGGTFTYQWKKDGVILTSEGENTSFLENLNVGTYDLNLSNTNTSYVLNRTFLIGNDNEMIWELTKVYDEIGTLIGSTKQYFNSTNKLLQVQSKNITESNVIVSQPLYDARGRLIGQTLPAPAFMSNFGYLPQFITNSTGAPYSYSSFDIPNYTATSNAISLREVDNPAPVGDNFKGSVGWYYSDNNTEERLVATTKYPYSRIEYDNNSIDEVKRSSAPHNELKMGSGHNNEYFKMLTGGELKRVYGYVNGWAGGDFLKSVSSGCNEYVKRQYVGVDDFKPFKQISYDADGMEVVSFFTNTGWLISTAYSGESEDGVNEDTYSISTSILVTNKDGEDYVDIHIPKGCEGTLHIERDETLVCPYKILDLRTNRYLESSPGNDEFTSKTPLLTGGVDIPAGIYRIVYIKGCAPVEHVFNIDHDVNYYDYTLYYYDYSGRLLGIVPPAGIDLYVDYPSNYSATGGGSAAFVTDYNGGNPIYGLATGNNQMSVSMTEPETEGDIVLNSYLFYIDTDAGLISNKIEFEDESLSSLSNNEESGAQSMGSSLRQFQYISDADWSTTDCSCQSTLDQCISATSFSEALISSRGYCTNGYEHIDDMGAGKYCLSCKTIPMQFEKKFIIDFNVENNTGESNEVLLGGQVTAIKYTEGWEFRSGNELQLSNVPGAIMYNLLLEEGDVAPDIEFHIKNVAAYVPVLDVENNWDGINLLSDPDFDQLENLDAAYERVVYYLNPNPTHSMYSLYDYNSRSELLSATEPDEGNTEYYYSAEGLLRFSQDSLQSENFNFTYYRYDDAYRLIESGQVNCIEESAYTGYYFENHYGDIRCSGNASISSIADDIDFDFDEQYNKTSPTFIEYDREYTNSELATEIGNFISNPLNNGYCQKNVLGRISTSRVAEETFYHNLPNPGVSYNQEKTLSKTWYSYLPDGSLEWTIQKIYDMPSSNPASTYYIVTTDYTYNDGGQVSNVRLQKDLSSDYFEHRYTYDDDMRLSKVETRTSSGGSWKEVAEYEYYLHGPLKRVELDDDLQGIDYVYNTMGWLKSINSPNLGYNDCWKYVDPGKDGFGGSAFEEDVFGMTIDYFFKDYERKNTNVNYGDREWYPEPVPDRYTGLIEGLRWNGAETTHGDPLNIGAREMDHWANVYLYNNKGWLTEAKFGSFDEGCQNARKYGNECISSMIGYYVNGHYKFNEHPASDYLVTDLTYDGNGNILSLKRNAHSLTSSNAMDDFDYNYTSCTNKLNYIDDGISSGNWTEDLDDQSSGYYTYDALGRIVEIGSQNLRMEYNLHGLVSKIERYDNSEWKPYLTFRYDEHGNRLSKTVYDLSPSPDDTYWYINNAGGTNVAVYYEDDNGYYYPTLTENSLMGMGKAGIRLVGSPDRYNYSISDHLGNVRATVYRNTSNDLVVDKYADYYPFGMVMPGRNANTSDYRHGYQGQFTETDGETGWENFELRQYDARMARWMSTDPYYQHHSPYLAMGNNPVSSVDPDGGVVQSLAACWAGASAGAGSGFAVGMAAGSISGLSSNLSLNLNLDLSFETSNHITINTIDAPDDFNFSEYKSELRKKLVENGFNGSDLKISRNDPNLYQSLFRKTGSVTFRKYVIGRDKVESGTAGYAKYGNPYSPVVFWGLTTEYKPKIKVATSTYVDVTLHEIGHGFFNFGHNSSGVMRENYKNDGKNNFTDKEKNEVRKSEW